MFTGLVESLGRVKSVLDESPGVRLAIDGGELFAAVAIGDSISINGCCLTVVGIQQTVLEFEAGSETLQRTNLGRLVAGSHVNLERSLRVGDRMGGHFVSGHIDGAGYLDERRDEGDWSEFCFRVPPALIRQMAGKGSVAVDGVSLTLVDVQADRFSVALIPHTLKMTTLGALQDGDPVNIETDLLAKYVEQQLRGDTLGSEPAKPTTD